MTTSEALCSEALCFEPAEPEYRTGECPAVGVGGNHSEAYSDDGEWICDFCGARPRAPVETCVNVPAFVGWTRYWPRTLSNEESLHLFNRHGPTTPGPCGEADCPMRDARETRS